MILERIMECPGAVVLDEVDRLREICQSDVLEGFLQAYQNLRMAISE
jgi:hypothetical protein